jgi:hypothetical protein
MTFVAENDDGVDDGDVYILPRLDFVVLNEHLRIKLKKPPQVGC